jgi:hypothetical protein
LKIFVNEIVEGCQFLVEVVQALSDKNLQIVESGQYLLEVEQGLTKNFKLEILSELVLLLPNTGSLKQFGDCCQIVLLLPNTDSLQQFEDFVRACSTSTKY